MSKNHICTIRVSDVTGCNVSKTILLIFVLFHKDLQRIGNWARSHPNELVILNFGLTQSLVTAGRSGDDYRPGMAPARLAQLSAIILTHLADVLINASPFAAGTTPPTVDDLLPTAGRNVLMPVKVTEFRQLSDYYWPNILSVDTVGQENPEALFNQRSAVLEGYRKTGLAAGFLGSSLTVALTPDTLLIVGAVARNIELEASSEYRDFEKNGLVALLGQFVSKALITVLDTLKIIDVSRCQFNFLCRT